MDPRDAFAVVVGIDRYGGLPAWDLAGPVADAVRFVEWFRAVGVPADRIVLLASPAGAGLPPVPAGVDVRPADRATVRDVLIRETARQRGRALFVVWGGHGFVDVERRRRLYYADASPDDPLDLDLDSLLARFATDRVTHLDRQFWIVDACQVEGPIGGAPRVGGHETFEAGDAVRGRTQDVVFAAGFGQPAVDVPGQRTGLFSREVLRILEPGGLAALTGAGGLAAQLREVFSDLRARGRTAQTPTYLWYRSGLGDEGHLLRAARAAAPPAVDRRLGPAALKPIVDALQAIPEFENPAAREEILRLLRGRIYAAIPRHQTTRLEAVSVVRTALRFDGGLAELLEAVRFFSSGDEAFARLQAAAREI
ncbi:hypothetical protein [Dactylosporangium sp. NPDC051541]|uniref:effector-associated domain 2-containing protein n=1 Tax=Dactylosporangium sp. NPDC051541 TaxID=3363977 RepID=UPI0037A8807A